MTNFEQAQQFFLAGELRKSITQYRSALRFEDDPYARARIYLELTRIYRMMVRMKNARLELTRAFAAIGLAWPQSTWSSTIGAYLTRKQSPQLLPAFANQPQEVKTNFLADLYEELGLSAYYLRQTPILLQSIIKSRKVCRELGPSRPLLNWYGGSACVFALIGLKRQSAIMIRHCQEVASAIRTPAELGKTLIWQALAEDYAGSPAHSAQLFERCLDEYGTHLPAVDLKLSAVALSINYLSRGHFRKALEALDKFRRFNPGLLKSYEGQHLDVTAWYGLGPKAMLGEVTDVKEMQAEFRYILSADRDEKWLVAQFLGHLLIAGRKTGLDAGGIEDLINRFRILDMSPRSTHCEAAFYWVAKAYSRFDSAIANGKALKTFKASLADLKRTPAHPTSSSHHAVLKAGLAWLEGKQPTYEKWREVATQRALAIDNVWALAELNQLQQRVAQAGGFH